MGTVLGTRKQGEKYCREDAERTRILPTYRMRLSSCVSALRGAYSVLSVNWRDIPRLTSKLPVFTHSVLSLKKKAGTHFAVWRVSCTSWAHGFIKVLQSQDRVKEVVQDFHPPPRFLDSATINTLDLKCLSGVTHCLLSSPLMFSIVGLLFPPDLTSKEPCERTGEESSGLLHLWVSSDS